MCSYWKEEEKPPFAYKWALRKRAKCESESEHVKGLEKKERAARAAREMELSDEIFLHVFIVSFL